MSHTTDRAVMKGWEGEDRKDEVGKVVEDEAGKDGNGFCLARSSTYEILNLRHHLASPATTFQSATYIRHCARTKDAQGSAKVTRTRHSCGSTKDSRVILFGLCAKVVALLSTSQIMMFFIQEVVQEGRAIKKKCMLSARLAQINLSACAVSIVY